MVAFVHPVPRMHASRRLGRPSSLLANLCCTVRGDLVRILGELASRRESGEIGFERVIIETTGLADPAPVAQTFFVDQAIAGNYQLDAIITVVDAAHAHQQLEEHHEAQEQVGFADRILISKSDLVAAEVLTDLENRLRSMNPRAPIKPVHFGQTELRDILDIGGFNLEDILKIEPDFLEDVSHEHDDAISSLVYRSPRPFEMSRLLHFLDIMLGGFGKDLLRYKGILNIAGNDNKILFQGVHMIMGDSLGLPWPAGEPRQSQLVFIGRNLPKQQILTSLEACHVDASA
jgi:G3E family GTPase